MHMRYWLLPLVLFFSAAHGQSIDIYLTATKASCGLANGAISAEFYGGTSPFEVVWSNGVTSTQLDSTAVFITGLAPGYYEVTITDGSGISGTAGITVQSVPGLNVTWGSQTIQGCDGVCENLNYVATPCSFGGIAPYSISVDPPIGSASTSTCLVALQGMCPGQIYTALLTDDNGCAHTWDITVVDNQSPVLISQTVTPSCPNGNTGSVVLQYDQVTAVYPYSWGIPGPPPTVSYGPLGQVTISAMGAGNYYIDVYGQFNGQCSDSLYVTVPVATVGCGTISGRVFADLQSDCDFDPNDVPLPNRVVTIEPGNVLCLTNSTGQYSRGLNYGSYTAATQVAGYTSPCQTIPVPFTLNAGNLNATVDLGLDHTVGPDAMAMLVVSDHRQGDTANYSARIINTSPYTLSGLSLQLDYDPLVTFLQSSFPPVSSQPGTIIWDIPTLAPLQQIERPIRVLVPVDPALLGLEIEASASIISGTPDGDPTNDTYNVNDIVIGPYDPNDKTARTSSGLSNAAYYLADDSYVDYTIRFQNTGSAPAVNVYLVDTITSTLDLSSLNILAASHTFIANLLDDRVLQFHFPNIMLPDSGADQLGSNGYIVFRLRPNDPVLGQTISNTADIYFDLNPAIRTNTSTLVVEQAASVQELRGSSLRIAPNPATELMHISGLDPGNWQLEIFTADGRSLRKQAYAGSRTSVSINDLRSGIYLLRMTGVHGTTHTARFIRQ